MGSSRYPSAPSGNLAPDPRHRIHRCGRGARLAGGSGLTVFPQTRHGIRQAQHERPDKAQGLPGARPPRRPGAIQSCPPITPWTTPVASEPGLAAAPLDICTRDFHRSLRMHRRLPRVRHRRLLLGHPVHLIGHIPPNIPSHRPRDNSPQPESTKTTAPAPAPSPASREFASPHPTPTTSATEPQAYSRRTVEEIVLSSRTQIRLPLDTHRIWFECGQLRKRALGAARMRRPFSQAKNWQTFSYCAANFPVGDSTLRLAQVRLPVQRGRLTAYQGCKTGPEAAGETLADGPSTAPSLPVSDPDDDDHRPSHARGDRQHGISGRVSRQTTRTSFPSNQTP